MTKGQEIEREAQNEIQTADNERRRGFNERDAKHETRDEERRYDRSCC